jgi:diacylglycerol kinase (ATP)
MTTTRRPILLLVNPVSGGKPTAPGGTTERLDPAEMGERLAALGLSVEVHLLEQEDDVGALAARAAAVGRDVVAAGGDGTIRPAASAVAGTDATLGIVPLGSWNNIARGVGLPDDPADAIALIGSGGTRLIDVGLAWHPPVADEADAGGPPPNDAMQFFEAAGVGLDAVGFGAAQAGERHGLWRALRSAWRALRKRRTRMMLTVDGRRLRTAAPAVTICNGAYHGMGFALAPDADPSDGMLDVVVFSGMTRWDVIRHFLAVARGRPRHEPRVNRTTAHSIHIAGERRTLPVHADGESIGTTPVAFAVRPAALRIFAAESQLPGSPLAAAASAPNTRA